MRTPSEAVLPTVRTDDAGSAQAGQNGTSLGVEAGLAALEGGVERTLADGEAEQFEQQAAQPPVADVVDEAQIHRQRDDVQTERRAGLQPLGQRRQGGAPAAAAVPGIALHPGHRRRHLRQVRLVEAGGERQVGLARRGLAVRAAGRAGGDGLVRHLGQEAPAALATEAARPRTVPHGPVVAVRLFALRRRQAGVAGRLGRRVELGLQLRNPALQRRDLRGEQLNLRCQRLNLRPKRLDERVFLLMRERGEVGNPVHR